MEKQSQIFRRIEATARWAAQSIESGTAEDLEVATWAQEIVAAAQSVNPVAGEVTK